MLELGDLEDAGLRQGRVQGDRVVPDREQQAVAIRPVRIVGTESQLILVEDGEDVGDAEGLADVALALHLAHVEGVPADPVGGLAQPSDPLGVVFPGPCLRSWLSVW